MSDGLEKMGSTCLRRRYVMNEIVPDVILVVMLYNVSVEG